MRWVDRGPEPDGVEWYQQRFTPGWVRYANNTGVGQPTDSYWRRFHEDLRTAFLGKCGYCERACAEKSKSGSRAPTVDHFRPKSRYPTLTYEWSNWIFFCDRCNSKKGNKWPDSGLFDPCAASVLERPERYFDYRSRTGEIIPKGGLAQPDLERATSTISDLKLNDHDMRKRRRRWIWRFQSELSQHDGNELLAIVDGYTDAAAEYCGITRMFLAQYRKTCR